MDDDERLRRLHEQDQVEGAIAEVQDVMLSQAGRVSETADERLNELFDYPVAPNEARQIDACEHAAQAPGVIYVRADVPSRWTCRDCTSSEPLERALLLRPVRVRWRGQ